MTNKGCVVCGKEAGWRIADDDHEWFLCDDHGPFSPGPWREARLAVMGFGQAIRHDIRKSLTSARERIRRLLQRVGIE